MYHQNIHKKMNKYVDSCPSNRTKYGNYGLVKKTERKCPLYINNERQCPEPDELKQERVRKTVDDLLKNIAPSRCCMQCPGQDMTVPCDSFKFLLKCVQDGGLQGQQSDRDYEQTIIEEIKRRINLGICGKVPVPVPPVLDYVKGPKKRTQKKTVAVKEKEVEVPKLVIPKPVVKKPPKPKQKPKPRPDRIIFLNPSNFKIDDTPPAAGTIQYRLSNRDFIQKGWTKIPTLPEVKYTTFNTFMTNPCGPLVETNIWKKKQSYRFYPDGRKMATIEKDGTTKVFYPNCNNDLAIHLIPYAENEYRLVVYFNKEEYLNDRDNQLKRKDLPAALFDSFGNGVVYSTKGQIRLNYDQAEGKFVERAPHSIHPPLHWKWQNYQEVIRRRKMLHHMSYGCPNIGTKYPNLTLYLPQRKGSSNQSNRRKQSIDSSRLSRLDIEKLNSSDKQNRKGKSKTNRSKKNASDLNQSISDEKTLKSSNSPESQKSPKTSRRSSWRRRQREEQEAQKFEICASELFLDDPLFEKLKEQDKLQTPLRIVLRIENGITLVITDQCHIHLEFKAFRQHLKFNLGVRVLFKEEPKFTDTLLSESQPMLMTPPPDMFRVYEHRSLSLQKLFRPQNLQLGKDKSKHKPNELICEPRKPKLVDSKECVLFKAANHPILIRNQCVLEPGETRPILPLKLIYHFENKTK